MEAPADIRRQQLFNNLPNATGLPNSTGLPNAAQTALSSGPIGGLGQLPLPTMPLPLSQVMRIYTIQKGQ